MAERMTDERLAEIERAVFDLEGWPVNCSEELLQALKAERLELSESRAHWLAQKIHIEAEVNKLREDYKELCRIRKAEAVDNLAAERQLARLVEGLKRALHDRCIGIRHHHDQPAVPIRQRQFEARIYNLIDEATGEGK